jgi:hypothetical protein
LIKDKRQKRQKIWIKDKRQGQRQRERQGETFDVVNLVHPKKDHFAPKLLLELLDVQSDFFLFYQVFVIWRVDPDGTNADVGEVSVWVRNALGSELGLVVRGEG